MLSAQEAHERGQFQESGLLWLWMQRNSRLKAVLRKRVSALPALPFRMEPSGGEETESEEARTVATILEKHWKEILPDSTLQGILRSSIGMGVAICRVTWVDDGEYWWPRLTLWPNDAIYYQDYDQRFYARTREGGDVLVTPGHGWLLYTPDGALSFESGSVLSLGIPCLLSSLSDNDWANYNAANSVVIRLANVPRGAPTSEKNLYLDNVEDLGRGTSTLLCPKNQDGSGFGMEQLDTPTAGLDTFERAKADASKQITIEILGQEKTTDLGKEGARSAVEALQDVEDSIIQADGTGIAGALVKQVLRQLCLFNWGNENLCPLPTWEVFPPEDTAAKASGWGDAADAAEKLDAFLAPTEQRIARAEFVASLGVILEQRPPSNTPAEDTKINLFQSEGLIGTLKETLIGSGIQLDLTTIMTQNGIPIKEGEAKLPIDTALDNEPPPSMPRKGIP